MKYVYIIIIAFAMLSVYPKTVNMPPMMSKFYYIQQTAIYHQLCFYWCSMFLYSAQRRIYVLRCHETLQTAIYLPTDRKWMKFNSLTPSKYFLQLIAVTLRGHCLELTCELD